MINDCNRLPSLGNFQGEITVGIIGTKVMFCVYATCFFKKKKKKGSPI